MADDEIDEDDFWQSKAGLPIGSVGSLERWDKPRKIKKRPIGFTSDIDAVYEEK